MLSALCAGPVRAEAPRETGDRAPQTPAAPADPAPAPTSRWHYGAYLDLSYAVDFNFPQNHLFRNRSTTPRVNELAPNMGLGYVRKDVDEDSRWGMEFGVQGGYDTKNFAYSVNAPKVGGADTLRHFSRANLSYLAPVGNGLTVQAGLFNSLIGFESLYAKDNFNYTRAWIADYSPYMMFGVNASYPINDRVSVAAYVINEYFHLSRSNDLPSYGGQVAWKATPRLTLKQTLYYGPDQGDTSMEFWRLFSDSIAEWKGEDVTVGLAYDVGTERVAGQPGNPRSFWMGGALFTRWHVAGPWSVAVRPEFYWDRNGRLTGFEQFVKAVTTTLEYKVPLPAWNQATFRLEHRYDESTGPGGGFFKGGEIRPGVIGLTPGQHLLLFALFWTFDSP